MGERNLEQRLTTIIRAVARYRSISSEAIRAQLAAAEIGNWKTSARHRAFTSLARLFREQGKFGKLAASLLVGVSDLGDTVLTTFDRSGILLAHESSRHPFGEFLEEFAADRESALPEWQDLRQRIRSYGAYYRLLRTTRRDEVEVLALLRNGPRFLLKHVLAITDLAFRQQYLQFQLNPILVAFIADLGTPEEIASAASALLAFANRQRPLDSLDLGGPLSEDLAGPEMSKLLTFGRILVERREIAKQLTLFSYGLEVHEGKGRTVYYVIPPSPAFEYGLRLGYIRADLSRDTRLSLREEHTPYISLPDMARVTLENIRTKGFFEIRDAATIFRRVHFEFPLIREFLASIADTPLFDDLAEREHLSQDFLFPLKSPSDGEIMITPTLALRDFMRIWRVIRFLAAIEIEAVRPYGAIDEAVVLNSVVLVSRRHEIFELITTIGYTEQQATDFLVLVSADVETFEYHYDIQYRPFVRIVQAEIAGIARAAIEEFVHCPGVVVTTSMLRNMQMSNKFRVKTLPAAFVTVVSAILGTHFRWITTNRPIKRDSLFTEVDIVILADDYLFLFECKHSVFPTEPHEQRDAWEDITHGVEQLKRATVILSDAATRQSYLAGWFPGLKAATSASLHIVPCVLCSHRIFSGSDHDGVAIRDYASLSKLAGDGVIGIGAVDEDMRAVMRRFRLTGEHGFSSQDLLDYISRSSKFFQTFSHFMRPVSRMSLFERIVIARETYFFETSVEDWCAQVQAVGGVRLPDEDQVLKGPSSLEELNALLKNTQNGPAN